MNKSRRIMMTILMLAAGMLILTACDTATGGSSAGDAEGQEAFVDNVAVTERAGHQYASVDGHYPDSCARISDVQQSVEGTEISIRLFVASPADMMCAQMLTPFVADILLETGGLAPGEYTVTVNDARQDTFTIGG